MLQKCLGPLLHEQIKPPLLAQIRMEILHTDLRFGQIKSVLFAHFHEASIARIIKKGCIEFKCPEIEYLLFALDLTCPEGLWTAYYFMQNVRKKFSISVACTIWCHEKCSLSTTGYFYHASTFGISFHIGPHVTECSRQTIHNPQLIDREQQQGLSAQQQQQ